MSTLEQVFPFASDTAWGNEAENRGHSLHVHAAQLCRKLES